MTHQAPDPAAERSPHRRLFTYEEALESFPAVRDLTRAAQRRIEALVNRIPGHDQLEARRDELEGEVAAIVEAWAIEVAAIGCEVKGLWLVDWDTGDGYYCWKHPEPTVAHFHGYDEGFGGRMPVS